jgi:hypothetical protein
MAFSLISDVRCAMDFTHPNTLLRAWFDKAEGESIEITYTFEGVPALIGPKLA